MNGLVDYQVKQINELFPSTFKQKTDVEKLLSSTLDKVRHNDNSDWVDYKKINKLQESTIEKIAKAKGITLPSSNSKEVETNNTNISYFNFKLLVMGK